MRASSQPEVAFLPTSAATPRRCRLRSLLNGRACAHACSVFVERICVRLGRNLQLSSLIRVELRSLGRLHSLLRLLRWALGHCRGLWRRVLCPRPTWTRRTWRRSRQYLAQFLRIQLRMPRRRDTVFIRQDVCVRFARYLLQVRRQCQEGGVVLARVQRHHDRRVERDEFLDELEVPEKDRQH